MSVILKKRVDITSVEARYELNFKRKRDDIRNLLVALKDGRNVSDIFSNNSIIEAVKVILVGEGLTDNSFVVTPKGESFISYPYKLEKENGIYSIHEATLSLDNRLFKFIIKMDRMLSNEKREGESRSFQDLITDNEFRIGEGEKGVLYDLKILSKAFCKKENGDEVEFDIIANQYESKYGSLFSGEKLNSAARAYVERVIKEKAPYLIFDSANNLFVVNTIKELTDEDLEKGLITKRVIEDISIINVPFQITNQEEAKQYAYMFMYLKLKNDDYFTLSEMNEIFQNEVLSKSIIAPSIKDAMYDFEYTIDGFEKYLPKDRYSKLSYRLHVMKELLGIDSIQVNNGLFSKVKSYDDVLNAFRSRIISGDVKRLYMVMGYPYADSKKNDMVNCIKNFHKLYPNIVIVNKSPKEKARNSNEIISELNDEGVLMLDKTELNGVYHDRYLIFEMNNGTYNSYLSTCEIGQMFNPDTHEPTGTLVKIPNEDLIRGGKNLINIIKGWRIWLQEQNNMTYQRMFSILVL